MSKILLTGFGPFGGQEINPSGLAAEKLKGKNIGGLEVVVGIIPVVTRKCIADTIKLIEEHHPAAVLNIGQAGGRMEISIEKVAVNIRDYRIPDNEGNQPRNAPVVEDGPDAYFATIPIEKIAGKMVEDAVPASVSYTAGTYCCNEVFYGVSHYIHRNDLKISNGFIHIPFIPQQAAGAKPPRPSLSLDTMVIGLETAIETIAEYLNQ